jgi:hypothetical protein
MGRGRAKAKQTKVARDLKYRTFETDFDQLQRELHGDNGSQANESPGDEVVGDADDPFDDVESAQRP